MKKVSKTLDPNYSVDEYRAKPLPTAMKVLSLHIPKSVDDAVNKVLNQYITPIIVAAIATQVFLQYH